MSSVLEEDVYSNEALTRLTMDIIRGLLPIKEDLVKDYPQDLRGCREEAQGQP